MARYSKQTWDTTSIFNPTRMNHIEQGIYDADLTEGGTIGGVLNINIPSSSTSLYDSTLGLGNNVAEGTVGNSRGVLRIYDKTQYCGVFYGEGDLTQNRYYKMPNESGFLVVDSQVPKMYPVDDSNRHVNSLSFKCDRMTSFIMIFITSEYGAILTFTVDSLDRCSCQLSRVNNVNDSSTPVVEKYPATRDNTTGLATITVGDKWHWVNGAYIISKYPVTNIAWDTYA